MACGNSPSRRNRRRSPRSGGLHRHRPRNRSTTGIDSSVAAWEKRGYWVKADRFRMEWAWAGSLAEKMRTAMRKEGLGGGRHALRSGRTENEQDTDFRQSSLGQAVGRRVRANALRVVRARCQRCNRQGGDAFVHNLPKRAASNLTGRPMRQSTSCARLRNEIGSCLVWQPLADPIYIDMQAGCDKGVHMSALTDFSNGLSSGGGEGRCLHGTGGCTAALSGQRHRVCRRPGVDGGPCGHA